MSALFACQRFEKRMILIRVQLFIPSSMSVICKNGVELFAPIVDECDLQKRLIVGVRVAPLEILPYKDVYAQEWDVVPGQTQCGKGDLVFKQPGLDKFLVVETKYLTTNSGHTARASRNRGRQKVIEQAYRYGKLFKQQHQRATVDVAICTNEKGLCILGHFKPYDLQLQQGPSSANLKTPALSPSFLRILPRDIPMHRRHYYGLSVL